MTQRHFCVTFWKKPEPISTDKIRYAIYGHEICPETKKEHWQSYIELNGPIRLAGLKYLYKDLTLHSEPRKGTREQARDYCKKDNKFEEFGTWKSGGQGARTDLHKIISMMKLGTKINDVILNETQTYCKYRNGLKDLNAELVRNRTKEFRKLNVILITGPTGVGKTRKAVEESKEYYKIEGDNLAWFQDYNEEKTLIIDEYNNDISVTRLLNLLDGYQLRLNVKGSHTYANWDLVYITTNLTIDELHAQAKPAHREALFRRITEIRNLWPEVDADST